MSKVVAAGIPGLEQPSSHGLAASADIADMVLYHASSEDNRTSGTKLTIDNGETM